MIITSILGAAGTGKTTRLMQLLSQHCNRVDPMRIGFFSFTRAAAVEAAERAEVTTGVPSSKLSRTGWFRTVHSAAYRAYHGPSDEESLLVPGEPATDKWLKEHADINTENPHLRVALSMWDNTRSKISTVDAEVASLRSDLHGSADWAKGVIDRYEQAKHANHTYDFADTLAALAGWVFSPHSEPFRSGVTTAAHIPPLEVCFFDEHQDACRLLNEACRKLARHASHVYLVGDPHQSIYGFSGSSPDFLLESWRDAGEVRTERLTRSWRCPEEILHVAERRVQQNSNYQPRNIEPSGGEARLGRMNWNPLGRMRLKESIIRWVGEDDTTFILTRCNHTLARVRRLLSECNVPYGRVQDPAYTMPEDRAWAACAFHDLSEGHEIYPKDFRKILKTITPGGFRDGTEAFWEANKKETGGYPPVTLDCLKDYGATQQLVDWIAAGHWKDNSAPGVDGSTDRTFFGKYAKFIGRYGVDSLYHPKLRIGTIHSSKGREADRVVLFQATSKRIEEACSLYKSCLEEERRVWYVGLTRAKKSIITIAEPKLTAPQHRISLEAN